ncbi:MAG: FAD-dependent oxidoreductase [Erysipelotrichaceae bacterium]|nr:FAD-dependent oxidoreductase [Erysipelotrichaceae bacterium]
MTVYDVIVAGGGPAGMTAALYALRNGKSVLIIEKEGFGGQITHSPRVENYPGTLSMSGNEFADKLFDQIIAQGAEFEIETVTSVECDGDLKVVRTEEGTSHTGRTVILATGVKHRMLGLENEEDLVGEGISYCAVCDGDFYTGKTVCVAGGGNSALQEAILLADKCREVIMLQDLPVFTGEARLQDVLFAKDNVRSFTNVKITKLRTEDDGFKGVVIEDRTSGTSQQIDCDGLFVAIGLIPENEGFKDLADLNSYGYFDSDEQCTTKTPGIFVAGDCRSKNIRQLTTAAADGAVAALAACRYINQ